MRKGKKHSGQSNSCEKPTTKQFASKKPIWDFIKLVFNNLIVLERCRKSVHDLINLPSQKINESTTFLNATINKKSINLRYMADGINSYDMTYVERENFSSILQDKFCAEHTFKNILDYNYEIVVTYIDNNFQIISEVLLDKYNCK